LKEVPGRARGWMFASEAQGFVAILRDSVFFFFMPWACRFPGVCMMEMTFTMDVVLLLPSVALTV
jgi:hypothetical protein